MFRLPIPEYRNKVLLKEGSINVSNRSECSISAVQRKHSQQSDLPVPRMSGTQEAVVSSAGHIKSLVHQIVFEKKGITKETRLFACEKLKKALLSLEDISKLGCEWRLISSDLISLLPTRINPDVKSAVADCIGAVGYLLVDQYEVFLKFITDAAKKTTDKYFEDRVMILRSLVTSLQLIGIGGAQRRMCEKNIEDIMNLAKQYLDTNESPVVLIPLLDICLLVAQYFPDKFKESFDDVVDFTVGWYIEPDQPLTVVDKCKQIITELRPFWFDAIPAAITLMKQFIDDANAYLVDVKGHDCVIEDVLRKTAALLRALVTLLSVINVPRAVPILQPFVEKLFGTISDQLSILEGVCVVEVGEVFVEMAEVLWASLTVCTTDISIATSVHAIRSMILHPATVQKVVLKLIHFFEKVFEKLPPEMTSKVMGAVIGKDGAITRIRCVSSEMSKTVSAFYVKLLTPKALPTLQASYFYARQQLLDALSRLQEYDKLGYGEAQDVEHRAIMLLNAFAMLGSVKNSLIAMMGLRPNLFTMLMVEAPIVDKSFMMNYPGCHFALLYVAKLHSEKHENFVVCSEWLNERVRLPMLNDAPTAKHAAVILHTVAMLLSFDDMMWLETRNLVIEWIYSIAFGISADLLQGVIDRPEMIELRRALIQSFLRHSLPRRTYPDTSTKLFGSSTSFDSRAPSGLRVRYFALLRRLNAFEMVDDSNFISTTSFISCVLDQVRNYDQEKALGLWQAIPPIMFLNNGITQTAQDSLEFAQMRIMEAHFTAEHFKSVVDFILDCVAPSISNDFEDANWMEDYISLLYAHACGEKAEKMNQTAKWRWALAQTAQYCIDNRMRTPLGKPLETFLHFENEVRRLALSSLSRKSTNEEEITSSMKDEPSIGDGSSTTVTKSSIIIQNQNHRQLISGRDDSDETAGDSGESGAMPVKEPHRLSAAEHWWRVRALLETIEYLDKLMRYATDGAVFQLSTVSSQSQQFFITNKTSCSSWLSRMYLLTMAVAYGNGYYAHVVRLGTFALRDAERRACSTATKSRCNSRNELSRDSQELIQAENMDAATHACVVWMARALIELGGYQSIYGLNEWVKKTYNIRLEWITHAAELARGRIEQAIDGLVKCLKSGKLPENACRAVRQLIITALIKLRNPDETRKVWDTVNELDERVDKSTDTPSGFEERSWKRMRGLTTFDPTVASLEACASLQEWNIENRFQTAELKLMQIARSFNRDTRNEILDFTRQLGEDARLLMMTETNSRAVVHSSVLHLLAAAIKSSQKQMHKQVNVHGEDFSFLLRVLPGSLLQTLTISQQLSLWFEKCRNDGESVSYLNITDESLYHLRLSDIARKSGNLRLADRQLRLHISKSQPNLIDVPVQNGWITDINKENVAVTKGSRKWSGVNPFRISDNGGLRTALVVAKLIWTKCGQNSRHEEPFALLCEAAADEVDRLLFKSNLMFNGAPTVSPAALAGVLAQQVFVQSPIEDSAVIAVGNVTKSSSSMEDWRSHNDTLSRSILTMASWLEHEPSLAGVALARSARVFWHMVGAEQSALPPTGIAGSVTGMVGGLLAAACKLAPHLVKAHSRFAEWAYKLARNGFDEASAKQLSRDEQNVIKTQMKLVYPTLSENAIDSAVEAISNSQRLSSLRHGIMQALSNELGVDVCQRLCEPNGIIHEFWLASCKRMFTSYECAIRSYFTYISECGGSCGIEKGTIGTVTAALRILKLLVKYPDALHIVIVAGMQKTNELIWKDILPQLFARLNHPVVIVRSTICGLLERIASIAPHSVCFPAIVGATQAIVVHGGEEDEEYSEDIDDIEEILIDDKKRRVEQERSSMFECCQRLVDHLETLNPEMVADVTRFVKELQRINMLHEERWLFVLTNLDHEMSKRLSQIEVERTKTEENFYLEEFEKEEIIREKTLMLSGMIFRILEDLYERTCVRHSQTANERQFYELFGSQLSAAFEVYRANRVEPHKAWQPFRVLLNLLTQRANKRSMLSLQTADISSYLCSVSSSHIPIPGQESKSSDDVVSIHRISRQAIVLPTKTRPKKIAFIGSDGEDYTFLFKGQEDLHLDERIMQLLHICNLMLSENGKDWPEYSARNYSVTPLGSRSGLIQWVDGATPIFHVYRKWQLRQAAQKTSPKAGMSKAGNDPERPSEIFFKKLKAAFEANSISSETLNDRTKWPTQILKEVIEKLSKETPRDLISREIWLRAGSADAWYRRTERFARSTAVMSMLGSILGLGDRHLDNVLVDLVSGEIVHIDYNVCFDKGRNLRVPETVPFRLTGNMIHALGPTQIEGTFRLSCEHVLSVLRAGKEVLLTILDAFVYDPLVDWAAAQDHLVSSATVGVATMLAVYDMDTRAEFAIPLARAMFSVRLREMKSQWMLNRNDLTRSVSKIKYILERLKQRCNEPMKEHKVSQSSEHEDVGLEAERIEACRELKLYISQHHIVMLDLRPLMRSLAHNNETFRSYLRHYNEVFSEPLVKGHRLLEKIEDKSVEACIRYFSCVLENIEGVYEKLLTIDTADVSGARTLSQEPSLLPPPGFEDGAVEKQQQEQNIHAKNVSKRVRQKLEGRDLELSRHITQGARSDIGTDSLVDKKVMTPAEQADFLIRQATSLSNLALMYEGWTAWV